MSSNKQTYGWLPLLILTVAGFTFNTSELVPIGLLTDIAQSFDISEARAGLLITVYAWVVAVMSLPLMLAFAKVNFKRLMIGVVAVFFVSHIGTALSTSYYTLMASRIGVALAHSLFWSIAPAMAVAVVSPQKRASALSALVAGGGIAMVAGLPLGRILGLLAGWRMTFAAIAVLSLLILAGLYFKFPSLPQETDQGSRTTMVKRLWHCKPLLAIYLITAVIITGHYTGYSYIEPFMAQIAGLGEQTITFTLSLFGVAGLLGSYIMSKWFTKHSTLLMGIACMLMPAAMILLLPAVGIHPLTLIILCTGWGLAITMYNIAFQNDIVTLFPHDSAVPMSLYSGIFNLGIGSGALVGGIVCDNNLMAEIGYIGGGIALSAAIFALSVYMPMRRKTNRPQ